MRGFFIAFTWLDGMKKAPYGGGFIRIANKLNISDNIHGLYKESARERQNKGQVFEFEINSQNKTSGRNEEQEPVNACQFPALFHSRRIFTKIKKRRY